ncbi:PD-(D/E)XK nuclease family protein [Flavobacterium sp.]|uniref:PD-(D/E)XK nuclease family protein n=1 Tax=Flavobacterium sp. TaxID=239 RepID=UPI002B4B7E00|nr:PD-(D/E)XK nuclease family protein [Flavobacterium sp.]HLP63392.1 PD-(D/E)XK nuclease family protein [Flavobacterium sp.]
MLNTSFLNQLAQKILLNHSENSSDLLVVLPNKRAKVFLLNELKEATSTTLFSPDIISIEDFIQDIAGIRTLDSIELLFQFYQVYLEIHDDEPKETFDVFANWAKTLLQDFNEIDRYLLDPDKILNYLENIKEIEHWSVSIEQRTDLIEKHLKFWKKLPEYYHSLYDCLLSQGKGYQGLIYREAVENVNHFSNQLSNSQHIIFAGFNALNQAEERIIQHLLACEKATVYWDIDATFLNDFQHDAGLFQRKIKSSWPHYKSNPYEWIFNQYQEEKNIHIISTSKSIGQAKIVGEIISERISEGNTNLQNVAVVLADENLMLPVLHSLPNEVDALNITMGFSSKNNPAQLLVSKLFKMHTNALNKDPKNYVFYYKEVLEILNHPLLEPNIQSNELVTKINFNNYTFITLKKLKELYNSENELFDLIFNQWNFPANKVLDQLSQILLVIKSKLESNSEEEKITRAFIYSVFKVINKLKNYFIEVENSSIDTIDNLYAIYKQVIDEAEVSFEGEPLNGLQIMGVLESRVLDFETVIITSVNEGKLPSGKSMNSFLPYDVKVEYGLPTYKEKDAIFAFHFYHLLQRAKNVYLIYNSDSDGYDAAEKSRFITQLEVEQPKKHNTTFEYYNPIVPNIAYQLVSVPKTDKVMVRLREIAEKGFSPSSLTTYIRNPIQFYFQRVLRISEVDEVEENIAVNTLGTIIHKTLEELYKPLIGRLITVLDIQNCLKKVDEETLTQFKLVYKEGEIKKGRNLLAFEVAKQNVTNFLNQELASIESGDEIQIIALEHNYERLLEHPTLPFPVLIKGNLDRVEYRNGRIRIIDYKTGKVEQRSLTLKHWNGLTTDIKNDKIIQVLAYAFMFENELKGREMEAGILSFKNLKSGFLPFTVKEGKDVISIISEEVMQNYLEQVVALLAEIMNEEIPFTEKL